MRVHSLKQTVSKQEHYFIIRAEHTVFLNALTNSLLFCLGVRNLSCDVTVLQSHVFLFSFFFPVETA